MIQIPDIKIPSVRVGSIGPASNIGAGGATPAPPTPITYLTQWKLMGNSTVHTDEYLTQWKVEGNSVVSNPSANLPQGYKKCKYLESHGTEYIELPFGFDKTDEVYLKGAFTRSYSDKHMVAPKVWNDDTNRFGLGCISGNAEGVIKSYIGIAIGSRPLKLTPLVETTTNILEYEYKDYIGRVGNSIGNYTEAGFGSTTQNLRLFYGYNSVTQCKIYEYRHKKDNTEYHLIPCLDNNDVPCLYDTVSNTAFYNDGTGTFGYELEQPVILSCGDLGQDGKYHVKISNGVTIYDIPLDEPLRKVNNVADSIEFVNGVATLTRNIFATKIRDNTWRMGGNTETDNYGFYFEAENKKRNFNLMCGGYNTLDSSFAWTSPDMTIGATATNDRISIKDLRYFTVAELLQGQGDNVILYELATPTTETIQVSPFPISPTDTYTSANDTPYSAFEYKKNVEIWSCGEYNPIDGKYHILVQPLGGSIADIALDEPLRKVNDVADSIEYADGVGTLTRNFDSIILNNLTFSQTRTSIENIYRYQAELGRSNFIAPATSNIPFVGLCSLYNVVRGTDTYSGSRNGIASTSAAVENALLYIYDSNYNGSDDLDAFVQHISGMALIYQCTPTTETIQVPQIEEADSYSCIITQGGKAVSWSSFETNSE